MGRRRSRRSFASRSRLARRPRLPGGHCAGPHGINIMEFCRAYNERTAAQAGMVIPAEITSTRPQLQLHHQDAAAYDLLKKAPASRRLGAANRDKVGTVTAAQVREIAEVKLADLNAFDIGQAMHTIEAPPAPWADRRTVAVRGRSAGPAPAPQVGGLTEPARTTGRTAMPINSARTTAWLRRRSRPDASTRPEALELYARPR